jgi:hypothetical protein
MLTEERDGLQLRLKCLEDSVAGLAAQKMVPPRDR